MSKIEALRPGRRLVCFFNFDRDSDAPGLSMQFGSEAKEPLFRVLKETLKGPGAVDFCLYTRGGDVNAVWPIVSLLREFDPQFELLVPFRCHSGGTLVALGAKKINMSAISELSPIDPSTGNQFNPADPAKAGARLGIAVEDVTAYKDFILEQMDFISTDDSRADPAAWRPTLLPALSKLIESVHPLALGNVHRSYKQIKSLATALLNLNPVDGEKIEEIIRELTTQFYSHLHMINRHEAKSILGESRVVFCSPDLDAALDALLYQYEHDYDLRRPFFIAGHLGDRIEEEARFISGAVESTEWSYLFETKVTLKQRSQVPPNIQIQVPLGQQLPLIPGVPRVGEWIISGRAWERNTEPKGVTK